jgi:Ca2+-binding RTX toxin-like protein
LPPITVLVNVPKPPAEKVKTSISVGKLVLTGTSHGDTISVTQAGSRVVVVANGDRIGSFLKIKKIAIDAGNGADLVTLNFSTLPIASTIFGGRGDDTIRSSIGADSINGNAGNDNLSGGNGNDTIYGSDGQDAIAGGNGNDLLYGDAGQDSLIGSNGADTLHGGIGFDVLSGGKGTDLRITQDKDLWDTIELSKLALTFLAERKKK